MVDAIGSLSQFIPSGASVVKIGSQAISILSISVLIILFLAIGGVIAFFVLRYFKFNKKLIIFEKVGGKVTQTGSIKAMEVAINKQGDTVFRLIKKFKGKTTLPRPELQTGNRTYWYFIREDGEWINITIEDIDKNMKEMGAKYMHPEIRYQRFALGKGMDKRYEDESFGKKYGMLIVNMIFIAIIGIMLFLIVSKFVSVANAQATAATAAQGVMDKAAQVLSAINNVCPVK